MFIAPAIQEQRLILAVYIQMFDKLSPAGRIKKRNEKFNRKDVYLIVDPR